ncbi:ABC transporter permease [uncultured Draconibacterium sp.]|uniref:ABC transporter permease n=1 Tax=uncultured Draconibacterium sp. TaxID=1573823 RepID=UPI0025FCF67D|nr:ABC transporter permease [uncultured Draconibacterium sp.]
MLKNYLTTALRFLKRNKLFAGINIMGLSLALAASFIILLYVINELSYNTYFKNRKQIYRVVNYWDTFKRTSAQAPYVLGQTMREEFSHVQEVASAIHFGEIEIKLNQEFVAIKDAVSADSEIFKIFDFKLVGQQENILEERNSIVLSKKQSQKLFPDVNPIGKEITVRIKEKEAVFIVKGVFDDIPVNSTFKAECFVSSAWGIDYLNERREGENAETDWAGWDWETWLLLNEKPDIVSLDAQFRAVEKKAYGENDNCNYSIQNLSDVYLHSQHIDDWNRIRGNLKNIRIFSAIAILIIIVAAFNYIILSTAVSSGRAQEIGIRKTNGASSQSIRRQLLNESMILALLVFPIAMVLAWVGKPYAEELFQTKLLIIKSNIVFYILVYVFLTLLIGFVSGLYTSSFLAKLNVISILKNPVQTGKRKTRIRSALIVVQLVIFCIFVSSTLIIHSQYKFALDRDPGYNNKNMLFVNVGINPSRTETFINNIKAYPDVKMVGGSLFALPVQGGMPTYFQHLQDKSKKVSGQMLPVNKGFIKTMGLTLLEGEDFSWNPTNDNEVAFYINETAVKELGITNPIGFATDPFGQHVGGGRIIGVVKDFNVHSIHEEIPPLFLAIFDNYVEQVEIRYEAGTLGTLLPLLKKEWEKVAKDELFNYKTISEFNRELYTAEKDLNTIISFFALFTLFIAAIGLFGVTLFIMKSQTKEIGIKRVFGGSEKGIAFSFVRENFIMVVIATVLSVPVTLVIMNRWLGEFAFKTNIAWWVFAITFILATLVVLTTVLFHSYRASRVNPVEALRYE